MTRSGAEADLDRGDIRLKIWARAIWARSIDEFVILSSDAAEVLGRRLIALAEEARRSDSGGGPPKAA